MRMSLQSIDMPTELLSKAVNSKPFLTFYAQTAYKQMLPYIPMRTGVLASTVNIDTKGKKLAQTQILNLAYESIEIRSFGAQITYQQPYAAAMYYGNPKFKTDSHPLATRKWDKVAFGSNFETAKGKKVVRTIQQYVDAGRLGF